MDFTQRHKGTKARRNAFSFAPSWKRGGMERADTSLSAPTARPHTSLGRRLCAAPGSMGCTTRAESPTHLREMARAFSPKSLLHKVLGRCPRLVWQRAVGAQERVSFTHVSPPSCLRAFVPSCETPRIFARLAAWALAICLVAWGACAQAQPPTREELEAILRTYQDGAAAHDFQKMKSVMADVAFATLHNHPAR